MSKPFTNILKMIAATIALFSSASALAQEWQGTWDTSYGQIKLQQNQMYVYGDYGTWGTIEAMASPDRRTLWGIYRRNDDGSYGYFEWFRTHGLEFKGRWQNDRMPVPKWKSRGTQWNGKRLSTAKPTLTVHSGDSNIGGFMGRAPGKYRVWYTAMMQQVRAADAPRQVAAPDTPRSHPLAARLPMLRAYQPDFKPRFIDVTITGIFSNTDLLKDEVYGSAGIYAGCEKATRSYALQPFGNRKNRVVDVPRANAVKGGIRPGINRGTLRFPFDAECLKDRDARIAIQVQTNIAERDTIPRRDEKWGYVPFKIYLDQIEDGVRLDGNAPISITKEGVTWKATGILKGARFDGELGRHTGRVNFEVRLIR